jgi:hypothetical protein
VWGQPPSAVQPGKARQFAEAPAISPHLKLELSISTYQLKVCPVGSDEPGTVRACSKGDENVEVQVAEFGRREALIGTDFSQYLSRLQPIVSRRGKDWVVSRQSPEKLVVRKCLGAPP